jgi:hypothetical protein
LHILRLAGGLSRLRTQLSSNVRPRNPGNLRSSHRMQPPRLRASAASQVSASGHGPLAPDHYAKRRQASCCVLVENLGSPGSSPQTYASEVSVSTPGAYLVSSWLALRAAVLRLAVSWWARCPTPALALGRPCRQRSLRTPCTTSSKTCALRARATCHQSARLQHSRMRSPVGLCSPASGSALLW